MRLGHRTDARSTRVARRRSTSAAGSHAIWSRRLEGHWLKTAAATYDAEAGRIANLEDLMAQEPGQAVVKPSSQSSPEQLRDAAQRGPRRHPGRTFLDRCRRHLGERPTA